MGKYMRKAKITGEVAVMEVVSHQSTLGVRTRARTLALQRLPPPPSPVPDDDDDSTSYLQLRSRRLEKPALLSSPTTSAKARDACKRTSETGKSNSSSVRNGASSSNSVSKSCSRRRGRVEKGEVEAEAAEPSPDCDVGVEVSFGDNVLVVESRERDIRESTPCSLIYDSETLGTPGSTTRPTASNASIRKIQSAVRRNIPTSQEMEDFFAGAEQLQQRIFAERYNFDPVNDCPLPGRYEWVRLDPSLNRYQGVTLEPGQR